MARSHQAKRLDIALRRRWLGSTTRELLETWESLHLELRRRGVQ